MNSNEVSVGIGIGDLCAITQIVFLILKWTGVISWAWPIVLIPLWVFLGYIAIVVVIAIIVAIVAG